MSDSHAISLVLTRMYLGPDSWRTSQIPSKIFTGAQRMIRYSMFVLLLFYIITVNDIEKHLTSGVVFFLLSIRAKLSVSWIYGRRMVCSTWTSSSLWWIWLMVPLYLPLYWKVSVCNNSLECYLRVKEDEAVVCPMYDKLHAVMQKCSFSCIWTVSVNPQPEIQPPITSASAVPVVPQLPNPDALAAVAQLFQSPHGQEVGNRMVYLFQKFC